MIVTALEWKEELKKELHDFKYFIQPYHLRPRSKNPAKKSFKHFAVYLWEYFFPKRVINSSDSMEHITEERFFFFTALAIRKLSEAGKFSKQFEKVTIKVKRYPLKDGHEEFAEYHIRDMNPVNRNIYFFNYYDKDKEEMIEMKTVDLCHLFIHSFIFMPSLVLNSDFLNEEEYHLRGVYLNTDWYLSKYIYFVDIKDYFDLLEKVIADKQST